MASMTNTANAGMATALMTITMLLALALLVMIGDAHPDGARWLLALVHEVSALVRAR